MEAMNTIELGDIITYDIETLKLQFLWMGFSPLEEKWYTFEISRRRNDVYKLGKFLKETHKDKWFVGFNNVGFDAQVVEYILRNYLKWYDLSPQEIVDKIYLKSQDIISDINSGVFPPYREYELSNKQIDLFKIWGLENLNRRVSLKWLEFSMNIPSIEEMPYEHWRDDLTDKQLDEIIAYCKNDIVSTYQFYLHTIGQVSHPFYQGKNKIQDRLDLIEYSGFSNIAINFSDVKVGDEINKKGYLELTGIDKNHLYTLKKNRRSTPNFTFGDCVPKYVSFKTKEFNDFYASVKNIKVNLGGTKQEFPFTYKGTKYTIAKGGIHSGESNRIITPLEGEIIIDLDISSQYPSSIVKRGLFPSHLGKKWLVNYKAQLLERLEHKRLSKDKSLSEKERKMHSSKEKGMKLSVNGSFGKTSERTSWQYDPKVTFYCTIGNQFEILMLAEMLELSGIHIISANTDGLTCLLSTSLKDRFYEICHNWEAIVGNSEIGQLEFTEYKKMVQESVNHYIIVKSDGETKIKGRFDVDVELNKNNTDKIGRIERKAIQDYFVKDIPIEKTIKECTDIYMFCLGLKASRDYHYETLEPKTYHREVYQRVIRFFVSTSGVRLMKIKNEGSEATGAQVTKICGDNTVTMFNTFFPPLEDFKEYNINYEFYIERAQEIVDKIERGGKRKGKKVPKEQLSLF